MEDAGRADRLDGRSDTDGGMEIGYLQFSPDGSQLAVTTSEEIRFWDVANGQFSDRTIPPRTSVRSPTPAMASCLAFAESRDGGSVTTHRSPVGSRPDGAAWKPFDSGETGGVQVFSENDATLVPCAACCGTSINAWKARVCQTVQRDLTAAEWAGSMARSPITRPAAWHSPAGTGPISFSDRRLSFQPDRVDGHHRTRHTATLLQDGRVLIAGGQAGGPSPSPPPSCTTRRPAPSAPTGPMALSRFAFTASGLPRRPCPDRWKRGQARVVRSEDRHLQPDGLADRPPAVRPLRHRAPRRPRPRSRRLRQQRDALLGRAV